MIMSKGVRNSVIDASSIYQAAQNGISYMTLYNRIVNYMWDEERAITTPPMARFGNRPEVFTKEELVYAEKELNIGYQGLYGRLRRGWSKERALSTPLQQGRKRREN
jgi:hypothetical protein